MDIGIAHTWNHFPYQPFTSPLLEHFDENNDKCSEDFLSCPFYCHDIVWGTFLSCTMFP